MLTYFRRHKWQRRVLTALLGLIIAMLLSIWLVPIYLDHYWIERLDADDPAVRDKARDHLWDVARQQPATRQRLLEALPGSSDTTFLAVREILQATDHWPPPTDAELWRDRVDAIHFEEASPVRQQMVLHEAILTTRDNVYLRNILDAAASEDQSPQVLRAVATLAGRLDEPRYLKPLISNDDQAVAATACLVAGLTGQDDLLDDVRRALYATTPRLQAARQAGEDDQRIAVLRDLVASASHALLQLSDDSAELLADMAIKTDDPVLREQLLWILSQTPRPQAAQAVRDIAARRRWAGQAVPASVLLAAERLGMDDQGPAAMDILRRAASGETDGLLVSQCIAAVDYARRFRLPCRQEAYEILRGYWRPNEAVLLSRLAFLLGQQADIDAGQSDAAPTREQCLALLRDAVGYATTVEEDGEETTRRTPFASAAAAVAQWLLEPSTRILDISKEPDFEELIELHVKKTSGFYLHEAVSVEASDPGDVVAWHLAASGRGEAFDIGLAFLPGRDQPLREYSPRVRSAGMILLALTAPEEHRQAIRDRIRNRLSREKFYARGAAECALLMLGDRERLEAVRLLVIDPDFGRRRSITALLVTGDRWVLDLMLWNVGWPLEDVAAMLTALNVAEVLAATAPSLPLPQAAARPATQLWQVEVMRQTYALTREDLELGGKP